MSDHFRAEPSWERDPDRDRNEERDRLVSNFPPLPGHLARKLLRPGEEVTWVRGPRWSPSWEIYITHPGGIGIAFLVALLLVGLGVAVDKFAPSPALFILAFIIMIGSIIVFGIFAGHFTRLVVTSQRIVILQGVEIRRTWGLETLPRSLLHFSDDHKSKTVDVEALQKMLGSQGAFVEAKDVWALGKQLDKFKKRDSE